MKTIILALLFSAIGLSANAAGLIIHTSELGVGKFHRYDNQVHNYGASAWAPYIMLDSDTGLNTISRKNADGSYAIFYTSLESMLKEAVKISKAENQSISVLNVHGHGLPGAMWFPADEAAFNSNECNAWKDAAKGADKDNYDQYYSPVSKSDILQIRKMSNMADLSPFMGCITGIKQWRSTLAKVPEFKPTLAADVQLHFASCVVGLGRAGEVFTQGLADLLLSAKGGGRIETSMNFGLGDWSIPKGMGFWDYLTDAQLNHDNSIYGTHREDREIAQKGTIRVSKSDQGKWTTALIGDQSEMSLEHDSLQGPVVPEPVQIMSSGALPNQVRIPGTNDFIYLK